MVKEQCKSCGVLIMIVLLAAHIPILIPTAPVAFGLKAENIKMEITKNVPEGRDIYAQVGLWKIKWGVKDPSTSHECGEINDIIEVKGDAPIWKLITMSR